MDSVEIGRRIRELRERRGLRQEDLAHAAKVDQTTISKLESGKSKSPRRVTLQAIADALDARYEDIAGEMQRDADTPSDASVRRAFASAITSALEGLLPEQFPIYDQAVGAGPGIEVAQYGFVEPGMEWRNAFGVRVSGQSMEPEIRDGDLVIVAREKEPQPGDVVVVSYESGLLVKRLRAKGRRLVLTGDNDDAEYPYDDAKFEGVVVEIRRRPR